MIACPACQAENLDGFKFCGQCGAALVVPVAQAEERKVVATLFCDLVSFTAMSETADPEDDLERAVRAGLRLVDALDGMARPDGSPL